MEARNAYISSAVISCAILVIAAVGAFIEHRISSQNDSATTAQGSEISKNFFEDIPLKAKAVAVYDFAEQRFLFTKNAEEQLPLASLTKLMTAYVASIEFKPKTVIPIGEKAVREEGDSGLRVGEHWNLDDLLRLTLVHSSNDGAAAIAEIFNKEHDSAEATDPFLDRMNEEARRLGLSQTFFINENGLDYASTTAGGYGSARDIALLSGEVLGKMPDIFEATAYPDITVFSLEKHKIRAQSTNKGLAGIPGLIASKTGFTDLAGGNLVVIFDVGPNHPVAAVALGSTIDGRFEDVQKLVWATLQLRTSLSSQEGEVD